MSKDKKKIIQIFMLLFVILLILGFVSGGNKVIKKIKIARMSPKTAEEIFNNPIEYYGKKVSNYSVSSKAPIGWRIFHSDGENIYLIADYYITSEFVPNGRLGSKATSAMSLNFPNVVKDYEDMEFNQNNNPAKKLLKKYYDSGYDCIPNRLNQIKFLMDTDVWSTFKSEQAEYAIGAPTLELFVESYNKTHPEKQIDMKLEEKGYLLKWSTESEENYQDSMTGFDLKEYNNLYVINNPDDRAGIVMISYEGEGNEVATTFAIDFSGKLGWSRYNCMVGLRPVACLKAGTQLVKVDDETYRIKE